MAATAAYLMRSDQRESWEYVFDSSRRARGFALYAAIRSLGRDGIREMVERCCRLARRMADQLADAGVEILNDVTLNQVLARFGDDDAHAGGDRAGAGRWHGLDGRHDLARPRRHADQRQQLVDLGGRCRRIGPGHPARGS